MRQIDSPRLSFGELMAHQNFLGFSYRFRPNRGQHDALDALAVGISNNRVNFVLDADVASRVIGSIVARPGRNR